MGRGGGVEVEPKCVFLCVRVFLLCGQDGSARRRPADGCLGCENTLSRRTAGRQAAGWQAGRQAGIPRPPKGGRLGDLGGTHSSLCTRDQEVRVVVVVTVVGVVVGTSCLGRLVESVAPRLELIHKAGNLECWNS